MHRRDFLAVAGASLAVSAIPAVVRAQTREPIKIGIPLPLTGPFGVYATDLQRGATLAGEELNARGGVLGRPVELIFRDDQFKPGIGAQRTQELLEKERVHFLAGAIGAHIQMAINEQSRKAKILYFSLSQSDEITAKPDGNPYTFHEAMNPTITARAVGSWRPRTSASAGGSSTPTMPGASRTTRCLATSCASTAAPCSAARPTPSASAISRRIFPASSRPNRTC